MYARMIDLTGFYMRRTFKRDGAEHGNGGTQNGRLEHKIFWLKKDYIYIILIIPKVYPQRKGTPWG